LNAELNAELIAEVQEFFGLPTPALVEKDYWVVKALAAIAELRIDGVQLVFSGGTALGRAHRLIRRMSEDIDLKIVAQEPLTRPQLRGIREQITACLHRAGFNFDPQSEEFLVSRNGSRFMQYRLPYPSVMPAEEGLRPGIQVELTVAQLRVPAVNLPVSSFVAEGLGRAPEITGLPCTTIVQTAAEKFVALTRRIGEERLMGDERDHTLLRHVYDLVVIREHYDHAEVGAMIPLIMADDVATYGARYPMYMEDPRGETLRVIAVLGEDPSYSARFEEFHRLMVYGDKVQFEAGLATLHDMASGVP